MILAYERIAEKLHIGTAKAKPFCKFNSRSKKLEVGTLSLHKSKNARLWRMFWRLKQ